MTLLKFYQNLLNRRPYLVQAIQTGTLMAAGDFLSQTMVEKKRIQDVDPVRIGRFAGIGFFITGPLLRKWYGILEGTVGQSKGPKSMIVLKKTALDQLVFTPVFICFFVSLVGFLQGKNVETLKKDLEASYFDILITNYYIWPWVQLFNFYFVPLQYQVLLVQIVALFWTMYLAFKTNREKKVV